MQLQHYIFAGSAAKLLSQGESPASESGRIRGTNRSRRFLLACATAAAGILPVSAATLNWDADGVTPVDGGSGIWDTVTPLWEDGAGGYVAWNNATPDNAILGAPVGTIALGEAITVGTLTINNAGYTLDLSGFNFTIGSIGGVGGTHNATIVTNTNPTTATFTTGILANSGPTLSGNMNVVLNGTSAWSPATTHTFTGILTLQGSGNVIASENRNLGSAAGSIRVEGSRNLWFSTPGNERTETFTRDIELVGATVGLGVNGPRGAILTGSISGTDGLRVTSGQGAVILAGANTFSGAVTFTSQNSLLIAAHNEAFGAASGITVPGGGPATTIGFRRDLNGNDLEVGAATPIILNGIATNSGFGMIHNFEGNNTFAGNITLGSNVTRTLSAAGGSNLTLTGVIGGGKGLTKLGEGTIILTGQNTYGTANATVGNETAVNAGILRLDFSQATLGHDVDILNFNNPSNSNSATGLALGGGTLEILGRPGAVNSQRFKNNAGAGNGFTINPGASAVRAIQNSAESLSMNFGQIAARNVGGTVDFTLPETGDFTAVPGNFATVGTSGIIIANGAAFMTVDGTDWAARDFTNKIVGGSTIFGFYTESGGVGIADNAQMTAGETTLAADTVVTSVRFHESGASFLNLSGHSLATGGILVSGIGNVASMIIEGTLMAAAGTANQDLVVIQNNTAADLAISAVIADNFSASGLTKSGRGTLVLSGANTYTGVTTVNEGVLKLDNASALGGGNLAFKGGVVGLTAETTNFTRALGSGAGQVQFLGSGGFAAYGGDRTVAFTTAEVSNEVKFGRQDGQPIHVAGLNALIFGADDADGTLIFTNPVRLSAYSGPQEWEFRVHDGSADVDARLTGVIRGDAGLTKTGAGTMELAAINTYLGPTTVNGGTLLVTGSIPTDSRLAVHNGSTLRQGANSVAGGHHIAITSGALDLNGFNETAKSLTLGGGAAGTETVITTDVGILTLTGDVTYRGNVANDKGATITGNLNLGTSTRSFTVHNSTGTANDLVLIADISGSGGLTKTGAGTLQLIGNSTYPGPTTVSEGVLGLTGFLSGSSPVIVNGGTFAGTGGVGTVTLTSGAIAPGNNTGVLNTADVFLNGGALDLEIVDALSFDQINVFGTVSFGGPVNLTLSVASALPDNTRFTIVDNNLTDPVTFADALSRLVYNGNALEEGAIFDVAGGFGSQAFQISYAGGTDDNDIVLTAVPEPGSAVMVLAGLGCLVACQRRRFRQGS